MAIFRLNKNFRNHILAVLAVIVYEQGLVWLWVGRIKPVAFAYYLGNVPFFYLSAIFLYPMLFRKRGFLLRKILVILIFVLGFCLLHALANVVEQWSDGKAAIFPVELSFYRNAMFRFIYISGMSFAYYNALLGINKAKEANRMELQLLEKERNQAELENAYLRSQINPHLLFNSLQFIEHQVQKGSDTAVKAVRLLGDVMHYSLRTTAKLNHVPLDEELEYIQQYIELARLRSESYQYFSLQLDMEHAADDLKIPPGILSNFIENVFKHGDLSEPGDPAIVKIEVRGRRFRLSLLNLKKGASVYVRTGIGMKNIRKRMDLLYPGQYTLTSSEDNNHYKLYFEIEL